MDISNFVMYTPIEIGAGVLLGHISHSVLDPMAKDNVVSDALIILGKAAVFTVAYRYMLQAQIPSQDTFFMFALPYFEASGLRADTVRLHNRFMSK